MCIPIATQPALSSRRPMQGARRKIEKTQHTLKPVDPAMEYPGSKKFGSTTENSSSSSTTASSSASRAPHDGPRHRNSNVWVSLVIAVASSSSSSSGGPGGRLHQKTFSAGEGEGGGEGDELARFTGRVGAGGYRRNVCGKSKNGTYEPHPRAPPPQNSETHSLTCAIPSSLSIDSPQWNLSDFGRRRGPCIRRESHSLIVEFGTTAAVTLIGPAGGGAELGVMYSMVVFCDDAS